MKRLFYVPLEPLPERYTVQLSAKDVGWLESRWRQANVNYHRIDGKKLTDSIKTGTVLDANGRGYWALSQVQQLLSLMNDGLLKSQDVIYFDDFWHPGIEALAYSFDLSNVRPKMYAMLHAQSVDEFDFTYPMRHWMRFFEKGIAEVLSGIFVTSTILKDLLLYAGVGTKDKIHICGLPYNSDEVKTHFTYPSPVKKNQVVFSSRWDKEKCPLFFLQIIDSTLQKRKDIQFVITTSAKQLRSNDAEALNALDDTMSRYPENVRLLENQTKEQYYHTLQESKVQINTADQDFVSWTLLEATTAGCLPLYPYFRSFPEALEYEHLFLYKKNDVQNAVQKLIQLIDLDFPPDVRHIYSKFDTSWKRMLHVMNNLPYENLYRSKN